MYSSHKWYAKTEAIKLTACYKVDCTYEVRKKKFVKRNQVTMATAVRGYRVLLPEVLYEKQKPHIDR